MAYETPLTIAEVMKDISANKYVLPSIQREYVWDTTQIETLFDSLMQDYPIGAFLFWEISKDKLGDYDFYEFLKNYHEKNSVHNKKADLKGADGVTAVLDGQQRLANGETNDGILGHLSMIFDAKWQNFCVRKIPMPMLV